MNSPSDPRTPPRFVPTLTEVVNVPQGLLPVQPLPESAPAAQTQEAPWSVGGPTPCGAENAAPPDLAPPVAPPKMASVTGLATVPTTDMMDAWAAEITRRVLAQLEQRLSSLLQAQAIEVARQLAEIAAQQLHGDLPHMVGEAVRSSFAAPVDSAGDAQQRGFSANCSSDADPG